MYPLAFQLNFEILLLFGLRNSQLMIAVNGSKNDNRQAKYVRLVTCRYLRFQVSVFASKIFLH